jgi:hypothetical protein
MYKLFKFFLYLKKMNYKKNCEQTFCLEFCKLF